MEPSKSFTPNIHVKVEFLTADIVALILISRDVKKIAYHIHFGYYNRKSRHIKINYPVNEGILILLKRDAGEFIEIKNKRIQDD